MPISNPISAATGAVVIRGLTDASGNPNYPAALKGDAYSISVAGKVGGASGKTVDAGDLVVALADNVGGAEASVGTSWTATEHNLVGALIASNNLSDLSSASTARANLGLGTAATQATGAFDAAGAAAAAQAASQPVDSDLTSIAALTTTSFGRGLLAVADGAAGRTYLTLGNVENTAISTWAGSTNLTTAGAFTTGTWNATVITGQYGGTGVANTGKTITVGASFLTTGTSGVTLAAPSTGSAIIYTLPTTAATLARTDAAQTFTGTQTFSGDVALTVGGTARSFTSDTTNSMSGGELLLHSPVAGAGTLSLRNDTDGEGNVSGLTFRMPTNKEASAIGVAFGTSTYPFSNAVFWESSRIFGDSGTNTARDIVVLQTHLTSGAIKYNVKLRMIDGGGVVFYKDGDWNSQTAQLTMGSTGSRFGGTTPTSPSILTVSDNTSSQAMFSIQNSSTSGYVSTDLYNSAGTFVGATGYGNASAGISNLQSVVYLIGSAKPIVLSTDVGTTNDVSISTAHVVSMAGNIASTTTGTGTLVVTGGIGASGSIFASKFSAASGGTGFNFGTSSSVPALKNSGSELQIRLGDDSGYGNIRLASLILNSSNLLMLSAGKYIQIATGTGQRAGNATLVGGTLTVTNTTITANSIIMLTRKTSGGTIGTAITYTLSAGASFTINSDNILDTSTFSYFIFELV